MMPELGKYAGVVLSSYAVGVALIVALVAGSVWQNARVKHALRAAEARQENGNG